MSRTWIDRRLCWWCERETDCEVRAAKVLDGVAFHQCLQCMCWSAGPVFASDPFAYRSASA